MSERREREVTTAQENTMLLLFELRGKVNEQSNSQADIFVTIFLASKVGF